MNGAKMLGFVVLGFVMSIASALFSMLFVMWIWNYLISSNITHMIFGVDKLNLWRAFLLSWLMSFLFKTSVERSK